MRWPEAACKDAPVDLFFPNPEGRSAPKALAMCQTCPVQRECLEEALALPRDTDHGIRGGATETERRRLRRRRNEPAPMGVATRQTCAHCDLPVSARSSEVAGDGRSGRVEFVCSKGHVTLMLVTVEAA